MLEMPLGGASQTPQTAIGALASGSHGILLTPLFYLLLYLAHLLPGDSEKLDYQH